MLRLREAILYSFAPHQLGFCGPKDKKSAKIIYDCLSAKKFSRGAIQDILKNFQSVVSYCALIAQANSIKNIFDGRVLEAYWLGNAFLDKVKHRDIKEMIEGEFSGPGLLRKRRVKNIADRIPVGVRAHHSFHVFYVGSITGTAVLKGKLLDFCRVSWGRVEEIKNKNRNKEEKKVVVRYQPLIVKDRKIYLGRNIYKEVLWNPKFLSGLKIGDVVSFHWNFICGILNRRQQVNLEKYTRKNIELFNERK